MRAAVARTPSAKADTFFMIPSSNRSPGTARLWSNRSSGSPTWLVQSTTKDAPSGSASVQQRPYRTPAWSAERTTCGTALESAAEKHARMRKIPRGGGNSSAASGKYCGRAPPVHVARRAVLPAGVGGHAAANSPLRIGTAILRRTVKTEEAGREDRRADPQLMDRRRVLVDVAEPEIRPRLSCSDDGARASTSCYRCFPGLSAR